MTVIWRRTLQGTGGRRPAGGSARRGALVVTAAGAAVACAGLLTGAAAVAAARAVPAAGPGVQWGRAEEVPGTARLNTFGPAGANAVSCWSVNNCAAGGYYNGSTGQQAFVVAERAGRWGKARQVPGLAALNVGLAAQNIGANAAVTSLSCAPGGYCVAGGYYTDAGGHSQGFVVTGVKGRWRTVVKVPGLVALNTGGNAAVNSVSCPAAGQCAAAGSYTSGSGGQGFVVSQASGVWGTAEDVPGLAVLNTGGSASAGSLSCGSAGNCAAGGYYTGTSAGQQAFVVSDVNGTWGTAEEVPGTAALNGGMHAQVYSVSCARDGYCASGGYYRPSTGETHAPFVAIGRNGRWDAAVALSGSALNGSASEVHLVSCPSARSCVAVGDTQDFCCDAEGNSYDQVWAASQTKGVWGVADLVPGKWARGFPNSLSCPSAGNCGVGGVYNYPVIVFGGDGRAFVASETNGRWARAELVPGVNRLDFFGASVSSVSCPSAGQCTAAGFYFDINDERQVFVTAPG
jgi:hypothetical protein